MWQSALVKNGALGAVLVAVMMALGYVYNDNKANTGRFIELTNKYYEATMKQTEAIRDNTRALEIFRMNTGHQD